jgi:hypothetical protein
MKRKKEKECINQFNTRPVSLSLIMDAIIDFFSLSEAPSTPDPQ